MWSLIKTMNSLAAAVIGNTAATDLNSAHVALSNGLSKRGNELAERGNDLAAESNALLRESNSLTKELISVSRQILERLRNLPDPGPLSFLVTQEDGTMLTFKINLPKLPDDPGDIASGKLTVTIGDSEAATIETTKEQTEVVGLTGEQGNRVLASFVYIDDAGNPSKNPSTIDVVLSDTIPPADAGVMSLEVTSES
jgi:hypothetical protein